MGDFGIGFLYVRRDLLQAIEPLHFGYQQLRHFGPLRDIGTGAAQTEWDRTHDATGVFGVGTTATAAAVILNDSLDYIERLSVEAIYSHRERLLTQLRDGLQARGINLLTPSRGGTPMLWFQNPNPRGLSARLKQASIFVSTYASGVRVAPSVYNTAEDIERLLHVLDQG